MRSEPSSATSLDRMVTPTRRAMGSSAMSSTAMSAAAKSAEACADAQCALPKINFVPKNIVTFGLKLTVNLATLYGLPPSSASE